MKFGIIAIASLYFVKIFYDVSIVSFSIIWKKSFHNGNNGGMWGTDFSIPAVTFYDGFVEFKKILLA